MKSLVLSILAALASLALPSTARASIAVSLQPSSQTINPGGAASIDLVISGLGNHVSPSVGGFDFDLTYNPAVLSATGISFGSHLNLGTVGSLQNSSFAAPGVIHLDEVSLESPADLVSDQASSFTLATFSFQGIGPGLGLVDFTGGSVSDETGLNSLPFSTSGASIQVSAVPETASTGLIFGIALAAILGTERVRFVLRTGARRIGQEAV